MTRLSAAWRSSTVCVAADPPRQGDVAARITNPAACVGGIYTSNTLILGVTTPPPAPTLTNITPNTVPAGSAAWLNLASVGSPDPPSATPTAWTYAGAGVTTCTWTLNMPATLGQYESLLFLNSSWTRAATSPIVTVAN